MLNSLYGIGSTWALGVQASSALQALVPNKGKKKNQVQGLDRGGIMSMEPSSGFEKREVAKIENKAGHK